MRHSAKSFWLTNTSLGTYMACKLVFGTQKASIHRILSQLFSDILDKVIPVAHILPFVCLFLSL